MSIRKRVGRDGSRSYQVRFPGAPTRSFRLKDDAEAYELDVKRRARLGALYEAPAETFGPFLDGFIERKAALGGKASYLKSMRESKAKLGELEQRRIPQLRRADVEDILQKIAAERPRTGQLCHDLIMAALRDARARGQLVDESIFEVERNRYQQREGQVATVEQLWAIASWMPETVRRLVVVAGFLGMRQHELLDLIDADLELDAHALLVRKGKTPAARRRVVFGDEVATILREQLLARPKNTRYVFASPTGLRYGSTNFMHKVYRPAVLKAGLEGFTFHDLRHTAISLMAIAGWRPEHIARQIGHTDGGVLIHRRYRHLFSDEMALQAAALDSMVKPKKQPQPKAEGA